MEDYTAQITAYLNNSSNSVQDTVRSLLVPLSESLNSTPLENNEEAQSQIHALITSLFTVAQSTSHQPFISSSPDSLNPSNLQYLQRLTTLTKSLSIAPSTHPDLNLPENYFTPTFNNITRDRFNFTPTPTEPNSTSPSSWANLNTYLSLLWIIKPQSSPFSLNAIWSIRLALETPYPDDPTQLAALIPGAATWILTPDSAQQIFESTESWPASPKTGAPARAGELLREEVGAEEAGKIDGFSRVRWAFWKGRFVEVAGMNGVDKSVRDVCGWCVERMGEIESGKADAK